jgi:hypothetical protein
MFQNRCFSFWLIMRRAARLLSFTQNALDPPPLWSDERALSDAAAAA